MVKQKEENFLEESLNFDRNNFLFHCICEK